MTPIKPRLSHSMRQPVSEWVRRRSTVEKLFAEYGYTVRMLNDGQHWEFKRGEMLIEWWPSTGTIMINKIANLSSTHTLDELRAGLKHLA